MTLMPPCRKRRGSLSGFRRNEPAAVHQTTPTVRWDDSHLQPTYANFCNVSRTREEVVLVFGINQSWERAQHELVVQLTDRLVLSPFAAKRLAALVTDVIRAYETRFGTLGLEALQRQDTPIPPAC